MLVTASTSVVHAADALEEIVVTAQKREENMQDVPIAITALTPTQLSDAGIQDTANLKFAVPGLEFSTALGTNALPNIRGVGTGAGGPGVENPVALYVDGVYIANANSGLMALNDIEQVAVLKGPQGTLFGRNATGGLVQITTRTPLSQLGGNVHAQIGNYGTWGGDAFLTGGLTDTLSASMSFYYKDQADGFGKNVGGGFDINKGRDLATRGKLLWTPGDDTRVTLSVDYSRKHWVGPNFRPGPGSRNTLGQFHIGGVWDTNVDPDFKPQTNIAQRGGALTVQHDFGDSLRLLSITARRTTSQFLEFDNDLTPQFFTRGHVTDNEKQFSQEFQLQSLGDGDLSWVSGLYYFSATGRYDPFRIDGPRVAVQPLAFVLPAGALETTNTTEQKTTSMAGFVQGTYKLFEDTGLTAGVRYTTDKKEFTSVQQFIYAGGVTRTAQASEANRRFNRVTWRLALDHRFSPQVLGYASLNSGFKSGLFSPPSYPALLVKPEYLDALEVGIKSDLLDNSMRLNVAAFYYDYTNIQVLTVFRGIGRLSSGDGAKTYGLDADLTWRATSDLTLSGGFSWLHGRYTDFKNATRTEPEPAFGPCSSNIPPNTTPLGGNCVLIGGFDATGNKLQLVPDYTANLGFVYSLPGSVLPQSMGGVRINGSMYRNGGWFADPQNRAKQEAYNVFNAAVTWTAPEEKWDVKLWANNLTNEEYSAQLISNDVGEQRGVAPPRTFGATVGYRF